MEKILTKTANASQDRELQDSELDSVSGGESFGPVVQGMLDLINQPIPPATPVGGSGGPLKSRAAGHGEDHEQDEFGKPQRS
jgi:hypothetical protein